MGGFNPQSVGMNRVRAHRRYNVNLQPLVIAAERPSPACARLHALPPHADEGLPLGLTVRPERREDPLAQTA